jgi:UDP-N-acetylmuramoylalanine--D-glutamate ligase
MPIAHVIGLGQSGIAAARLLTNAGWQVTISDAGEGESQVAAAERVKPMGIATALGYRFDPETLTAQNIPHPELVVISPGVSWNLPGLVAARAQGIEIIGEVDLARRHLPQPWVGITGTNGKTTTTALVAAIFAQAGLKAPACGNIGLSVCDVALRGEPIDWIIAEISSYQLESHPRLAPQIAVWTTLTPDHLERHGTLENYSDIKASLLEQAQTPLLNGDDPYLREHLRDRWPHAWWTTLARHQLPEAKVYIESGWIKVQGESILPLTDWQIPGDHNLQNLLMSVGVAHLAGIPATAIATAVRNFKGVVHRLEQIGTWRGIEFINDSKATNYDAAQIGLAAVAGPVILLAGGQAKIGDDLAWIETIQKKATTVLLFGEAAPQFAQRLDAAGYQDYKIVKTIAAAVPIAAQIAEAQGAKTVLLSPACASFDQYPNFEVRGDDFRQVCQTWFQQHP